MLGSAPDLLTQNLDGGPGLFGFYKHSPSDSADGLPTMHWETLASGDRWGNWTGKTHWGFRRAVSAKETRAKGPKQRQTNYLQFKANPGASHLLAIAPNP